MQGKKDRKEKEPPSAPHEGENLTDWFKKNITDPTMIQWYVEQLQSHHDLRIDKPDTYGIKK